MANANIRHEVFCFTRYNIQRILGSPKLYLILIILSCYILQLVFCPRTLDGPIQYLSIHKTNLTVLEPYILIVNGYYPLQFIMIGFILLISDAPFLEAGIGNYLIRSKRSRWFLGQIAYILFLSVIYNIFLLLITTLPFIPYLRLSTNWSPLIQNYFSLQVDTNYSLAFADTSIADTTLGIVYLTISLYSNSSLSLFVIGIFYVLEILRNGIGFFPYEFTVLNIILFYFNFFFLRMWIILETATSSSISIPTCQYSLLFYSIILALSIILGLKWTKKFDFQLKNIFTTSY